MLIPLFLLLAVGCYGEITDYRFTCPGAGNFPNPEDCGSFYICATGSDPVLQDCPGDLLFDPDLKICNLADAVDCEINGSSTEDPNTTSRPSTEEPSTTNNPSTEGPSTDDPSTDGPSTVGPSTGIPSTEDPSTDDPSTDDSSTVGPSTTGIPGTDDPNTETPTTEDPNPIGSSTLEPPTTGTPGFEPDCPETGTAYLENPTDCTTFFICIEGDYALIECPLGYGFDESTKDCKPAEAIGCISASTPTPSISAECPPTGVTTVPNPSDCGTFFLCYDGSSSLITCAIGFEYNQVSKKCEEPATAGCSVPTQPTVSTPPGPTTSTSSTTVPPGGVPDCSSHPNGEVFPNPRDCSAFFQCSNGLIMNINCPPGLEFNAALKVCDRPENANCQEV